MLPDQADTTIRAFTRSLDETIKGRCGISYSSLISFAPTMTLAPPGVPRSSHASIVTALRSGTSPERYADTFIRVFRLVEVGRNGVTRRGAERHNLHIAAINEMCAQDMSWEAGNDGAAYRQSGNGTLFRIAPDMSLTGGAFRLSESDTPVSIAEMTRDSLGRVKMPAGITYSSHAPFFDLDEPLEFANELDLTRTNTASQTVSDNTSMMSL